MRVLIFHGLMLSLLAASVPSLAEIYSWKDANGKTHFGDKVPEQYKNKSEQLRLQKSNAMPIKANNQAREPALKHVDIYPKKANATKAAKVNKTSNCQAQLDEYERNSRCFASCRIGNNSYLNTRCVQLKGCKNMRKPHCD